MSDIENARLIISKRIQEVLDKNDMTQSDLAKILSVSESTVGKWILMKSIPRMGIIQKLSDYFNVPKSYFLEEPSTYHAKGVRIPVLGRVAAGIPIEAIEDVEDWEEIPESMAKKGEYFALRIKGDSMLPEIKEGDVVIVRKQPCVDSGEIAIVLVNGTDATCKKIQKQESGITLIGYNTAVYSPTFYTIKQIEDLPVRVLGKVIEVRRKL